MKRMIPADTVDANGKVHETVGENIRRGAKELDIEAIVDVMFPVGSYYCGENLFVTGVGEWELVKDGISKPYLLMVDRSTGFRQPTNMATLETSTGVVGVALRLWKRVA